MEYPESQRWKFLGTEDLSTVADKQSVTIVCGRLTKSSISDLGSLWYLIHSWKLTWNWKIPMFDRKYINTSSNSGFSIVMLVFGGGISTNSGTFMVVDFHPNSQTARTWRSPAMLATQIVPQIVNSLHETWTIINLVLLHRLLWKSEDIAFWSFFEVSRVWTCHSDRGWYQVLSRISEPSTVRHFLHEFERWCHFWGDKLPLWHFEMCGASRKPCFWCMTRIIIMLIKRYGGWKSISSTGCYPQVSGGPPKKQPFGLRQFLNLCCHSHVSFGGGNRINRLILPWSHAIIRYFSGPSGGDGWNAILSYWVSAYFQG